MDEQMRKSIFNSANRMIRQANKSSETRTQCFYRCWWLSMLVLFLTSGSTKAGFACLSNPCVYGVCIDDLNSTYSCYCIDGYTGVHCQTNWDECWSGPCLNGGTCIDGVASYNCTCPDGFLGLNCEENFNECQSNPCQNGGQCHDKDNAFYCTCALGYEGEFCELDIAVCDTGDRCHNGAACIEGPGLEFSCRCTEGFEGRLCDAEINECASSPCQNGAICIDKFASYVCACPMGFSGTNCEEEIMVCASSPCANQALCLMEEDSPTCYCVPDYHGERCELQYDECQLGPDPRCVNGATCVDGVDEYFCTCGPNFTGQNCECLMLDEDGQIEVDCNYTAPTASTSEAEEITKSSFYTPTMESYPFSTDGVWKSSTDLSQERTTSFPLSSQPISPDATGEFTDPSVDVAYSETATGKGEGTVPSVVPSLFPASSASDQYTPTSPSEGATDSSVVSRTTLSSDPDIKSTYGLSGGTDATKEKTSAPDTTVGTGYSTQEVTQEVSIGDYFPTAKPSAKLPTSDDGSAPSEFGTTPIDALFPTSDLPRVSTLTPELSSFFTESPTNRSVSPGLQGEDQVTDTPTFTTNGIGILTSLPDEATQERHGSTTSLAPIIPVATTTTTTRSPEVIEECDDTVCANGGTCAMTPNGIRCHCDFRYAGPFCDVPVSIQNAAFSKESFLRHIIYRRNSSSDPIGQSMETLKQLASMSVRFKAKLTSREGLILLATAEGDDGNHYVALFLHKGLLQFQFSCGLQTMLLSEIEGTVNNGYELNVKVQLNFNDRYSHCNASLHVNETLAMSGEQPTWLGNVLRTRQQQKEGQDGGPGAMAALASIKQSWLHLGGRPIKTMYTLSHNISRSHGFTGCIYDLEINSIPAAIFDNAEDAYKIYECTSLACLSSPCRNGAMCVEADGYGLTGHHSLNSGSNAPPGTGSVSWSCKCSFGYMGKTCERSVCDNNPCRFGGTCVTFPESGYLCLCPYGKHGHFCEHDLDILQPSFFGSIKGISSYVAYPIAFPLEDRFEFSFKIIPTTTAQISLLAFIGQPYDHHDQSDHFSVSFIQGFILVTWNLGSGPRRIFTQQPIQVQSSRPTTIQAGRNGRTAWLSIDGKVNISGNSPGSSRKLNVAPQLYIGGHEAVNFSSLPHDLPLHSGFQGCLFDIRLVAGPVHIPLQHIGGMRGRSVGQCGTKECHRHACQNNGACLQHGSTFTCICQEDWNGILCSQKLNPCDESVSKCAPGASCFPLVAGYECDCPFGKVGKRCESNLKYLSDVSFSGRRSYLALRWPNTGLGDWSASYRENEVRYEKIVQHSHIIPHNHSILLKSIRELDKINDVLKVLPESNDTEQYAGHSMVPRSGNYRQLRIRQLTIELQVRPLSEKGLILFVRTFDSNAQEQGFISISLQGGVVEYRISATRTQTAVVRSNHVLATGEWHFIRIAKYGKRLTLWVEGKSTSIIGSVREEYVSLTKHLYLGGLPDLSTLPYDAISGYPVSFRGCIRHVNLNGTRITLNDSSIVASRNINDCDGTPCGGDICAHGGLCWLDEHSQPRCKCPEYSKGVNCEIQESCEIVQCRNSGQCLQNGRCSCGVGWTGHYCEIATTKYSSLGFNDRSYILIPSQKIKMKDKRNDDGVGGAAGSRLPLGLQISFNISTLEDGMLAWTTDEAGRYFGIGIRNGFLVVVSNMLEEDPSDPANNGGAGPWKAFVADGDWHNVLLETKAHQLHLSIDGYELLSGKLIQNVRNLDSRAYDKAALSEEITYLGGFPDENVYNRTMGNFATSFNGCIQHILLGNQLDELDSAEYDGANIHECAV
ncbi:protein eyes shut [Anopheles stephensi]|uniref:protein eyes shut n=1 Tax=Anopheles stephensi TaxID=30069 RepID=UPI001658834F|nr:protein eyes shut [Anopheles stephensi]